MVPVLESERLLCKKLSMAECAQHYVNWMNDPLVYRFLESGGDYTIEKLRDFLVDVDSKQEMLFWAIYLKRGNKHIGNIKIDPVNWRHGLGEYGILMGDRSEWGKGYAKEASHLVLEFCFQQLKLRKITLGVVAANESAVRLYNSLGFELEGTYKKHGLYDNVYHDLLRMAIFNPSFEH